MSDKQPMPVVGAVLPVAWKDGSMRERDKHLDSH